MGQVLICYKSDHYMLIAGSGVLDFTDYQFPSALIVTSVAYGQRVFSNRAPSSEEMREPGYVCHSAAYGFIGDVEL